jgi:hypothetical protein
VTRCETFTVARGKQFRTELLPEMLDAGFNGISTVDPTSSQRPEEPRFADELHQVLGLTPRPTRVVALDGSFGRVRAAPSRMRLLIPEQSRVTNRRLYEGNLAPRSTTEHQL